MVCDVASFRKHTPCSHHQPSAVRLALDRPSDHAQHALAPQRRVGARHHHRARARRAHRPRVPLAPHTLGQAPHQPARGGARQSRLAHGPQHPGLCADLLHHRRRLFTPLRLEYKADLCLHRRQLQLFQTRKSETTPNHSSWSRLTRLITTILPSFLCTGRAPTR